MWTENSVRVFTPLFGQTTNCLTVTKIRISDGEQIRQDIVGGNTVTFEFPQWSEYSVTAVESEIDYLGHNVR